ncbi:hypothetical protein BDR05DRAFT_952936 [Suillus weaverae]|nr:hypothetical protein BDR05DRAFT_952936 [Suillus weaverae]
MLQDVFDVIAVQDHLDDGISLLVQFLGSEAGLTISPKQIGVNLYITPQELQEVPQQVGGDIAVLVQSFSQEFAIPHLQHFTKYCNIENIKPPKPFSTTYISIEGPQYLPAPLVATGAHIMCSAQVPKTFVKNLQNLSLTDADSKKLPSAVIHKGVEWAAGVATKASNLTLHSQIRQQQPAKAFVANRDPGPTFSAQWELGATNFNLLLISIGPNMDAILDRFKLGDEVLPKLHVLIQTVCSSYWESVLRALAWDLPYEQAALLSRALLADLQGVLFEPEIIKIMLESYFATYHFNVAHS